MENVLVAYYILMIPITMYLIVRELRKIQDIEVEDLLPIVIVSFAPFLREVVIFYIYCDRYRHKVVFTKK